ncbi:MAG: DUF5069 domain-containing protein [Nitrospiraceae bacterium]|nr:DUF5069 domain-containing protein [Nitrospiraceae bacterium]
MKFVPRNGRDLLGDLPWLGRMIDKARMINAGSPGDYEFPCGMDSELLNHLRISPGDFLDLVKNADTQNGYNGEAAFPDNIDTAVLDALSLRTPPTGESGGGRNDRFFTSVFLVRNSRLLNQLETEESG